MNENDSLDPVASWEFLGRLCPPDAWDGEFLRPDQILRDDLMDCSRGWSVQRTECTPLQLAADIARELAIDPATATVAVVRTSAIRDIKTDSGDQAFLVIENYLAHNPAHALTFSQQNLKPGSVRMIRERLIRVLTRRSNLEEIFQ